MTNQIRKPRYRAGQQFQSNGGGMVRLRSVLTDVVDPSAVPVVQQYVYVLEVVTLGLVERYEGGESRFVQGEYLNRVESCIDSKYVPMPTFGVKE